MTESDSLSHDAGAEQPEPTGLNTPTERRTFLGLLVAGPTVAAAAYLTRGASTAPAEAAPSGDGRPHAQRLQAHGGGRRHTDAGQPAAHRLLRPRGLPHRPRVPDDGSRQDRGARERHRLLRPPSNGSGPGHHHGDRHAGRRGDGRAAGQGQDHPVGLQTRARVQHVHRRVQHHQLPVLPRADRGGSGEGCAAAGGRRPPRLRGRPAHGPGGPDLRPRTARPCPTASWPPRPRFGRRNR